MSTFCPNPKSIYKNFEKKLQKNCKKFAKKLQKNCKKVAKKLQKSCKKVAKILQKNLQNFCRFFAEFLQLHILQKVLHFRPREESVIWTSSWEPIWNDIYVLYLLTVMECWKMSWVLSFSDPTLMTMATVCGQTVLSRSSAAPSLFPCESEWVLVLTWAESLCYVPEFTQKSSGLSCQRPNKNSLHHGSEV